MPLKMNPASAAISTTCQLLCHSRTGWSAGVPPCPLQSATWTSPFSARTSAQLEQGKKEGCHCHAANVASCPSQNFFLKEKGKTAPKASFQQTSEILFCIKIFAVGSAYRDSKTKNLSHRNPQLYFLCRYHVLSSSSLHNAFKSNKDMPV